MNCSNGNSCLWLLILLLLLGNGNILSSRAFTGCGWPIAAALAYCMYKNGTLSAHLSKLGLCGCNNG